MNLHNGITHLFNSIRHCDCGTPPGSATGRNRGPEIKVRNRKTEPVDVTVVVHLYRWYAWEIPTSSVPYAKKDSQKIEFKLRHAPGEEKLVSYSVHYSW